MSSFNQAIENITPEIYQNLKLAIEIGKWPDGRKLTQEQKELCLQAVIAWELQNLPEGGAHRLHGPAALLLAFRRADPEHPVQVGLRALMEEIARGAEQDDGAPGKQCSRAIRLPASTTAKSR